MAVRPRIQIDDFPPVMLKRETRSRYKILHELTGTFRVHVMYRTEKRSRPNGWGLDITTVRRWQWAVEYQSGPSSRYIYAFHDFDDHESCLEGGLRIALQWMHADDRAAVWRDYLVKSDGPHGERIFEVSEGLERAFGPRESEWR